MLGRVNCLSSSLTAWDGKVAEDKYVLTAVGPNSVEHNKTHWY